MNYLCRFEDMQGTTHWLVVYDSSAGECIHDIAESIEAGSYGALMNKYEYVEVKPWQH